MNKIKYLSLVILLFCSSINLNAQSQIAERNLTSNPFAKFGDEYSQKEKSVGLGIVYSLLLPGMGELYAGDYSLGKFFTIADAGLWLTLFGVNFYANTKRDDYIAFAQLHARVNPNGKDDTYWGIIGNYDDIFIYNDEMELERNYDKVYDTQTHYWKWDEVGNRKKYRAIRNSSETAFNNMKFVVSALILNRIASAIDAVIVVKNHNRKIRENKLNYNIGVNYLGNNAVGLSLNIYGRF